MNFTIDQLKEAVLRRDAPFFTGDLNLNLIGVRSKDRQADTFNDLLCVAFEQKNEPVLKTYPITTDPGVFYRKRPINAHGTAILAPGHYPKCWTFGAHRGKYRALVQRGPMTVYRDNDKDGLIDDGLPAETGYFGINLHYASVNNYTMRVDHFSAGCQVFQRKDDFGEVMDLAGKSAKKYGAWFSYTLLIEEELS